MGALPSIREMEPAWRERDAGYDGVFFLAVTTTGIFCRPSCPARKPLARNVQYFATVKEAVFAGFRPCKRCRPLDTDGRPPEWVQTLLTAVEGDPAARLGAKQLRKLDIDPARARRYFLKHYGMTFQAYCRGRRMSEALQQIREGAPLDDVGLGHGYESNSGFRDAFQQTFGKPPGQARTEGCILTDWIESPVGPFVVGCTPEGICLMEFSDRRMLEAQFATLRMRFGCAIVPGKHVYLDRLKEQLGEYFAGARREFTVPLVYPGTAFQQRVWDGLLKITYGETRSYEDLANAVGAPNAQRAVGTANGMNRIAIVIPCHRVVNKGGKLGGYGGGLWRKQFLLDLERRVNGG